MATFISSISGGGPGAGAGISWGPGELSGSFTGITCSSSPSSSSNSSNSNSSSSSSSFFLRPRTMMAHLTIITTRRHYFTLTLHETTM
ncbi:MAG TPA: hypothetical protein ENK81_00055 [Euryarchaeota archaeon]|nr:hypothetical protein [Euryarchaeota archaeon]